MQKKYALITGASAGLGWEYAIQLASLTDFSLILVARRTQKLEELATIIKNKIWSNNQNQQEAIIIVADLTKEKERQFLLTEIKRLDLRISCLINNAGFGSLGNFETLSTTKELEMIELNCKVPAHLCKEFLPLMLEENSGLIVNVASTAAYQPMPYMATYGATKAFLLSFSVALAVEAKDSKVKILAHCPGPTDTEFHLVVGLEKKLSFLPPASAKKVVSQAIASALSSSSSPVHINGRLNWFLAQLNRVFSRRKSAQIVEKVLRKTARENALNFDKSTAL
jgi:uncharacterized protein